MTKKKLKKNQDFLSTIVSPITFINPIILLEISLLHFYFSSSPPFDYNPNQDQI